MNKIKPFFVLAAVSVLFFALSSAVMAAEPEVKVRDKSYSARFVSQSEKDPIVIEVGSIKDIVVKFQNIGSAAWDSKSSRYVSAYTMEPRYRDSEFKGDNWISAKQTSRVAGVVKPGQTGELLINLRAPEKTGDYLEQFYLAAENHSWVKGGYFYLKIKAVPKGEKTVVEVKKNIDSEYSANRFGLVPAQARVAGGENIRIVSLWQNIGKNDWPDYSLVEVNASGTAKTYIFDDKVASGQGKRVEFDFVAPKEKGKYDIKFKLQVSGKDVGGDITTIDLPVEVVSDAFGEGEEIAQTAPFVPRLAEEPKIRVGVWKPQGPVQFVSFEDDYNVFDDAELKGTLPRSFIGVLDYIDGVYVFHSKDLEFSTGNFVRLEPISGQSSVFTLYNYEHYVSWKGPMNFNKYRGAMEYRLSEKGTMYVINELLFEDYIAGIAETSAGASMEYIKALLVAARSYAHYIKENTDKHASRYFDVISTTGDQLYLGYESERLMPRVVEAAQATRGIMATYENNVVVTPYFGNSNGRTKSWTQVWGGKTKPWLVPVVAEYDSGFRQLGHGVGMSQRDCALRAEKQGLDYISLLKYYYTGVNVEKIYN